MGVKVKLADGREVIGVDGKPVQVAAGEVVEVDEGTARVLAAQNLAGEVHANTKITAGTAADKAAKAAADTTASVSASAGDKPSTGGK